MSAGQRQRIGLARALYGNPFVVIMDEPNSNLDGEGEAALTEAIKGISARGGIAIVIAHRPSAIAAVEMLAIVQNGRMVAFGRKEDVMNTALHPAAGPVPDAIKKIQGCGALHDQGQGAQGSESRPTRRRTRVTSSRKKRPAVHGLSFSCWVRRRCWPI